MIKVLIVIIVAVTNVVQPKIVMMMSEEFEDCTEGGAKYFDFSGLEYEYVNDTSYFLNGKQNLISLAVKEPTLPINRTTEVFAEFPKPLEMLLLHREVRAALLAPGTLQQKDSRLLCGASS